MNYFINRHFRTALGDCASCSACRDILQVIVNMADRTGADTKPKCTPAELMLKVVLTGTLSHYETRGMVDDKRLDHMLSAGKQILYKTHQESDVRYVLFIYLFLFYRPYCSCLSCMLTCLLPHQAQSRLIARHLARLHGCINQSNSCTRVAILRLEESPVC